MLQDVIAIAGLAMQAYCSMLPRVEQAGKAGSRNGREEPLPSVSAQMLGTQAAIGFADASALA